MNTSEKVILLTRPRPQSEMFARNLRGRFGSSLTVTVSPLLEIVPVEARLDLSGVSALLFTSTNGVAAFTERSDRRDIPCFCVGSRTAALASGHGMTASAATGNTGDLVRLVMSDPSPPAGACLHIRGFHSVGSVVENLNRQGRKARDVVLYDQIAKPLSGEAASVLNTRAEVIVPLFSPRTAEVFMEATDQINLRNVTAVCISQNAAHALEAARFGAVRVSDEPDASAMLDAIAVII